ncbi:hypothetical protein MA16_Dca023192 [Dendrobium catenatum]|uniref:Uncharacterized protein n=1 Tax=Dendrobium catenatum TaxID=906689 RepID=A0A2I0VE92_9ASPA|nr:hypothetical protein MA16_Dca023192 [Dendrobium catenatum]
MDVAVSPGSEAVPMTCDEDALVTPIGSPNRVETPLAPSTHRITSPMSPYNEALRRIFSEDDSFEDESDEDIPVHQVCETTRRGHSDEQREPEDQDEREDPEAGGSPRAVATDTTVLHLQTQMATGKIRLQDSDSVQPLDNATQTVQMISSPSHSLSHSSSHSDSQSYSKGSSGRLLHSSEGEWQLALSKET